LETSDTAATPAPPSSPPREATDVIAVIPKSTNLVFWEVVRSGAEAAGAEFGYQIDWQGPDREANSDRQIQLVDEAIEGNVAGVVLAPVDRFLIAPSVEKLAKEGVPCAIIDSGVQSISFVSYSSTDNYAGGMLAARRMGELLGGKGNVLVVEHLAGSQSTRRRVNGFTETLTNDFPEIVIVESRSGKDTVETAMQAADAMLEQHPDVQGLFACNITTSVGALQALQKHDRKDVRMVAFDPDKALVQGMREGQIDAIILQNPYQMGYEGVKALALNARGEAVPRIVDTGLEVVTRESLNQPHVQKLLGLR
jgi:ribose transport system substrate-binding protein